MYVPPGMMWNACGITQAVRNAWPRASKSRPQGLLVPSAKISNLRAAGRIFEDLDAVARFPSFRCALWILVALHHPEAAPLVDGERDGIDDVGFGREKLDFVLRWNLEAPQ